MKLSGIHIRKYSTRSATLSKANYIVMLLKNIIKFEI